MNLILRGESVVESGKKVKEKRTSGNPVLFERKEPKESDFKAPEENETGYTEKSWAKPEENMAGKETQKEAKLQERKEPSVNEFTAPGELETGYTKKSWAKPENFEDKGTERTEETRHEIVEETIIRNDMEARERETSERETRDTRKRGDLESRERETSEREARKKIH
jgi:hypothetical protein